MDGRHRQVLRGFGSGRSCVACGQRPSSGSCGCCLPGRISYRCSSRKYSTVLRQTSPPQPPRRLPRARAGLLGCACAAAAEACCKLSPDRPHLFKEQGFPKASECGCAVLAASVEPSKKKARRGDPAAWGKEMREGAWHAGLPHEICRRSPRRNPQGFCSIETKRRGQGGIRREYGARLLATGPRCSVDPMAQGWCLFRGPHGPGSPPKTPQRQ